VNKMEEKENNEKEYIRISGLDIEGCTQLDGEMGEDGICRVKKEKLISFLMEKEEGD